MDRIIVTLLFIDAAIQRRFDAFIFFLMRRFGWQKSIIRYALWAIVIVCILVDILCIWITRGHKLRWSMVTDGLWLVWIFSIQRTSYQHDRTAEEKGVRSLTDARPPLLLLACKLLICIFFVWWLQLTALLWILTKKIDPHIVFVLKVKDLETVVCVMAFLALIYLVRTPPTAPPEKEKTRVLIPLPQETH
jgi:hypothetical protein